MEFSRPEYWSGQPFPSPAYLPDPGIELGSLALQADSLPTELSVISGKPDIREEIQKSLGNALFLRKMHRIPHKMKDVNHHIIHIPALPTCITTAGMFLIFLSKMQSTTTIKIPEVLPELSLQFIKNNYLFLFYSLLMNFSLPSKSLHMVTAAMKLKDAYSLEGKL